MNQAIIKLAVPSIISNITVPLLGLVDVAIVGHIGGASYIGAVAIGSMLFNVIYWLFGFLRMGTSGMTSQALGRRDFPEVVRLLIRATGIGVGIGMLFLMLQKFLIGFGLWVMQPDEDVLYMARLYCKVCIWGAPAVLGLYGFTGWFIGMQNTRLPMWVSISQNIVNIIASLVFVFVFELSIVGVALGTVIAQWWGFLMAATLGHLGYHRLMKYPFIKGLLDKEAVVRFFVLNRDIFLRTVCLVAVSLFFTAAGTREGTVILAVNTLLMTLFTIFSYFMDGFAYAAEALSGKYYGAGNIRKFQDTVRDVFVWGAVTVVFFTLLYIIGGERFLGLLTSDASVVVAARDYFWWAVLIPVSGVAAFIFDGIFIGMTQSKGMLLSTSVAAVCFFALFFGLHGLCGNHALWLAFLVYLVMRGVVEWGIYRRISRNWMARH